MMRFFKLSVNCLILWSLLSRFTHHQILAQDHRLVDQSCISEKCEDPRCLKTKTLLKSPQAGVGCQRFLGRYRQSFAGSKSGFFATSLPNTLPFIKVGPSRITYILNLNIHPGSWQNFTEHAIRAKVLEYGRCIAKMWKEKRNPLKGTSV